MSSHFRWYPSESEVIVPFNARYSFPSQANKAVKMTPRIPPKNGGVFNPGSVIRLEFPAQVKTKLIFRDTLTLTTPLFLLMLLSKMGKFLLVINQPALDFKTM
jgi:hypothetical protein